MKIYKFLTCIWKITITITIIITEEQRNRDTDATRQKFQ